MEGGEQDRAWAQMLAEPGEWRLWLADRLERLVYRAQAHVAVALLADPEAEDVVKLTTSPPHAAAAETRPELIAAHDAAPLDEVISRAQQQAWNRGQLTDRDPHWGSEISVLAATPLRVQAKVVGCVAIGMGSDGDEPAWSVLEAATESIEDRFELQLCLARQQARDDWRLGVLNHVGALSGDLSETIDALLRHGFASGPFRIVGAVLFEPSPDASGEHLQALELPDRRPGPPRPVPVRLPAVGRLLRRTLAAGQTVSVTAPVRELYLRDAPAFADFMEARGFQQAIFSPLRTGQQAVGAVLALSEEADAGPAVLAGFDEFAALVAAAIRSYRELEKATEEASSLRSEAAQAHRLHDRVVDFGGKVLLGGSLQSLTQELATELDTPLLVERTTLEHRAFAWPAGSPGTPISEHQWLLLTAPLRDPATLRELYAMESDAPPRYVELPEAFPHAAVRVVVPVRVAGDMVGFLSSLRNDPAKNPAADRRLATAAMFVGLQSIREQTAEEMRHHLSSELINDLLSGRRDMSVQARLRHLEHEFQPPFFLVALSWQQRSQPQAMTEPTARMITGLAASVVSPRYSGALVGEKDDLVLIALRTGDEREALATAGRVAAAVEKTFSETRALACVSRRCTRLWEIGSAYESISKVLRLFETLDTVRSVVSANELGSYTALLQTDNIEELRESCDRWLAPLLTYDSERGSELVSTLHAYLRNWGHQRKTAVECSIHVSTLKYRLQRIVEIAGLDLTDPETRTQALLACQIRHTIGLLQGESADL